MQYHFDTLQEIPYVQTRNNHSIHIIVLTLNVQTINLHGKVTDQAGQAIPDAIVKLVGQELKDTTGADGTCEIIRTEVAVFPELQPEYKNFVVDKGSMVFSLPETAPSAVDGMFKSAII